MTEPRPVHLPTDAELLAHLADLVEAGYRRQTWLFLLDDDDWLIPSLIRIDDLPVDPDPEHIAVFSARLGDIVEMSEVARIVLVWERPGPPTLRMQEADWVAGVAASGAPVRAQLLASDDGVRLLDPRFEALVA